jgi:hypothetical protein
MLLLEVLFLLLPTEVRIVLLVFLSLLLVTGVLLLVLHTLWRREPLLPLLAAIFVYPPIPPQWD